VAGRAAPEAMAEGRPTGPDPPPRYLVLTDLVGRCFNCLCMDHVATVCTNAAHCLHYHTWYRSSSSCLQASPFVTGPLQRHQKQPLVVILNPRKGDITLALPTSWSPWPAHGSYTPPKLSSTSTPESTLSRHIRPSLMLVPSFPLWSQLLEAPGRRSHQYRSSPTSRGCTRSPNNRFSSCSRSVRLQIVFSSRTARGRHHSCCCSTMGTDRPEPFSHYSGTRCSYPSLMSQHTSSPSTPSKPSSTLLA
jgi:hypothetical protein